MNRKIFALLASVFAAAAASATLAACGGNDEPPPEEKKYPVTVQADEGCTAQADKKQAEFGESVTVTVTVTDPDMYIEGVYFNDTEVSGDGSYTYTVTGDTTVKVELAAYEEVYSDGGVTFGGGDPMVQWEFLIEALKACKARQIHTAIETEGYADTEVFLKVMEYIDFAFVDIKHMNSLKHEEKTGVRNERILENLRALKKSGWNRRIILRTPVIPGFNDDEENARNTIAFMKENGYFEINLLPFHRMGTSKWEQLGLEYPYRDVPNLAKEALYPLQQIYLDAGIACYVDTDVIYSVHPIRRASRTAD